MKELKKPLSYEEQIDTLINKHQLTISDSTFALNVLSKIGYYRLSGYGYGLKEKDNKEIFISGVSIENLYEIYKFDSLFKNALFNIIEQIEVQIRTQIGDYMANKYGALCYLDKCFFDDLNNKEGKSIHDKIINNFKKECKRQQSLPFVQHYIKDYNNRFPIWVAFELFTFGNLSSFYDIMKDADKMEISKLYNCKKSFILKSWLLSLVEVRNICAHYTRLYNIPLKQTPFLFKENIKYRQKVNKVFPILLVIKRMLNGDERWEHFLSRIKSIISQYRNSIRLSYMGFPSNWEEVLHS